MGALAEDSIAAKSWGERLWVVVAVVVGLSVTSALAYWLFTTLSKPSPPTRQVTRIAIIPDTPPPPPPPPKEEKRPEPPKDQKEVKVEQPKPVEAPPQQAEQLKMEGAAGDGPSPFAAGSVTNEYKGGDVGTVGGGKESTRPVISAAMKESYFRSVQQCIERQLRLSPDLKVAEYDLVVDVAIDERGRLKVQRMPDADKAELTQKIRGRIEAMGCPPPSFPLSDARQFRIKNTYER